MCYPVASFKPIPAKLESTLLPAKLWSWSELGDSNAAAVSRHLAVLRLALIGLLSLLWSPGSGTSLIGENCAGPSLGGGEWALAFGFELGEAVGLSPPPLKGNVGSAIRRPLPKGRASDVDIPRYPGANMRGSWSSGVKFPSLPGSESNSPSAKSPFASGIFSPYKYRFRFGLDLFHLPKRTTAVLCFGFPPWQISNKASTRLRSGGIGLFGSTNYTHTKTPKNKLLGFFRGSDFLLSTGFFSRLRCFTEHLVFSEALDFLPAGFFSDRVYILNCFITRSFFSSIYARKPLAGSWRGGTRSNARLSGFNSGARGAPAPQLVTVLIGCTCRHWFGRGAPTVARGPAVNFALGQP